MENHKYSRITPPRKLNSYEEELFSKFLSYEFTGKAEIADQLDQLRVEEECNECHSIRFTLLEVDDIKKVNIKSHIPIEAAGVDTDGVKIEIILFVDHGYLDEIIIYRVDGEKVIKLPNLSTIEIFVPEDWSLK